MTPLASGAHRAYMASMLKSLHRYAADHGVTR